MGGRGRKAVEEGGKKAQITVTGSDSHLRCAYD